MSFSARTGLSDWDIGVHPQGYLFLTAVEAEVTSYRARVEAQRQMGLADVEFISGAEIRRRFPFVSDAALAATFRAQDGWLSAHQAAHGFFRASGASAVLNTAVTGITCAGGRVTGVETDNGSISAPVVVIAAGPYAAKVTAWTGATLPLHIVRRQRVTIGGQPLIPQWAPMVIDGDTGAHWRPESQGAALAWAQANDPPSEPAETVRANPDFPFEVLEGVARLCPFWEEVAGRLKRNQVFLQAGQYADTPDEKPIIGPHPNLGGLFFSAGYGGHGVMSAPGAGRLLADLVVGRVRDADNPFSFSRLATLDLASVHKRLL